MRFLWELRSCLGGAATAEAAGGGQQPAVEGGTGRETTGHDQRAPPLRKVKSTGSVTHWKPNLQAISEDRPVSQVVIIGGDRRPDEADDRKRASPARATHKSPAKAAPPTCHVEDYWKYSQGTSLPAFSPTPFLF